MHNPGLADANDLGSTGVALDIRRPHQFIELLRTQLREQGGRQQYRLQLLVHAWPLSGCLLRLLSLPDRYIVKDDAPIAAYLQDKVGLPLWVGNGLKVDGQLLPLIRSPGPRPHA